MTKVLIVYASDHGSTKKMAMAIAAFHHGANVARVAAALKGQNLFAKPS